jgi:hypothetical protein
VRELFAGVKNDLGRIDVLYNNAGLDDREDHSVSPNSRPMLALGARRNTSALLAAQTEGHRPQSTTSSCPVERRSGELRRAGCPGCLAAVADRSSWMIADG